MKNKHILLIVTLLALTVLLSACGIRVLPSSWPGITVAGDKIYVAYNNFVYALEPDNGNDIWAFPEEAVRSQTFFAKPVLTEDGQVLVGTYNHLFYSLDAGTGRENWMTDVVTNYWIGSPLVTKNGIYAPNADHSLYSFDENGNPTAVFTAEDALWAAPITDGETIYLASMDHNVYALDIDSLESKWVQTLNGAMVNPPALSPEGVLYVGTFASEVVAIDSQSGDVLWENPTTDWVWASPVYHEGLVYAADMSGMLYTFDAQTGEETQAPFDAKSRITGSPLIQDSAIYLATESGEIFTLDTEGKRGWTETIDGRLLSSPVAAGDLILFGVVDGGSGEVIVALDTNGNQQWVFAPDK